MIKHRTAESVTEGHPDKVCDIISDALVDKYLSIDHEAIVSVKALASRDLLCIAGEVGGYKCKEFQIEPTVRDVVKEIGYNDELYGFCDKTLEIQDRIDKHDINDFNKLKWDKRDLLGARDQGFAVGYACNETDEFMPLPISLAHALTKQLTYVRKNKILDYLGPDGKAQITLEYEGKNPKRALAVIISNLHAMDVGPEQIKKDLEEKVIGPVVGKLLDKDTRIHINPTGRFIAGGPAIDTGITGRKLIVDTYGEACRHGGGAFSGKDPTSTDRCGAYLARYIAKNIVAAGISEECEIDFSYAIGAFAPLYWNVTSKGTGKVGDERLKDIIGSIFDLTISGTISQLSLRNPIYKPTASQGHFGRPEFPWEKCDKVEELKGAVKNV